MSNKEITRVPEILPDNLAAESVEFVTFLKKYYEWMGQEGNPSHEVDVSLTQRTLDNAVDFYLSSLYNELGYGFVLNNQANQKNIIDNLAEIYSAKGSLQSVKVMFRALFGEEVDIKLPKDDILKASSGNWLSEYSVIVQVTDGDPFTMVGKYVEVQTDFPNTPTQTFDVEVKRVSRREESTDVYEVYVSRYFAGFFYYGSKIYYKDVVANLKPSMSQVVNVEDAGSKFRVGESFRVNDYVRNSGFNDLISIPNQFRRKTLNGSGYVGTTTEKTNSLGQRIQFEDVDVDVRSDGTITQTIKNTGSNPSVTTKVIRGKTMLTRIEFENGDVKEFKEELDGIPTPNLAVNWDAIAGALTELSETHVDSEASFEVPLAFYNFMTSFPNETGSFSTSLPSTYHPPIPIPDTHPEYRADGVSLTDWRNAGGDEDINWMGLNFFTDPQQNNYVGRDYVRLDISQKYQFRADGYSVIDANAILAYSLGIRPSFGTSAPGSFNRPATGIQMYRRITDAFRSWNYYCSLINKPEWQFQDQGYATSLNEVDYGVDTNAAHTYTPITIPQFVVDNLILLGNNPEHEFLELILPQTQTALEDAGVTGYKKGDINNSGSIDTADLVIFSKYMDMDVPTDSPPYTGLRSTLTADQILWIETYLTGGENNDSEALYEIYASLSNQVSQTSYNALHQYLMSYDGDYISGYARGDVTQNGTIDADDVKILLQRAAGYYEVTKGGISRINVDNLIGGYVPDSGQLTLNNVGNGVEEEHKAVIRDGVITSFNIANSGEGLRQATGIISKGEEAVIENLPEGWRSFGSYYEVKLNLKNGRVDSVPNPGLMYNFPDNPVELISTSTDAAVLNPVIDENLTGMISELKFVTNKTNHLRPAGTYQVDSGYTYGGSNGTGAEFTINVSENGGSISEITLANGGSGYQKSTTTASVTTSTGTNANIIPIISSSGVITGFKIPDGGKHYDSSSDTITITDTSGNGSGAAITGFETTGGVADIFVKTPGVDYSLNDLFTIPDTLVGGNSSGDITFRVAKTEYGVIGSIDVTRGGTGYSSSATIKVSSSRGRDFEANLVIKNNCIDIITLTDGGSGYTEAGTTVAVTGSASGTGAQLEPVIVDGVITEIKIVASGKDYNPDGADTIVITGDGTGANISEFETISGVIESVNVTNGGIGFRQSVKIRPLVSRVGLASYDPNRPVMTAVVQNKVITNVEIIKEGIGYPDSGMTITNTFDRYTSNFNAIVNEETGEITGIQSPIENNSARLDGWASGSVNIKQQFVYSISSESSFGDYYYWYNYRMGDGSGVFDRNGLLNQEDDFQSIIDNRRYVITDLGIDRDWASLGVVGTPKVGDSFFSTADGSAHSGTGSGGSAYRRRLEDNPDFNISLGDTIGFEFYYDSQDDASNFRIRTGTSGFNAPPGVVTHVNDNATINRQAAAITLFTPEAVGSYEYVSLTNTNNKGTITVTDNAAKASVDIDDNKIVGFVITDAGQNYFTSRLSAYDTITASFEGVRADASFTVIPTTNYVKWIDEVIAEPLLGSTYNPLLVDGPGSGANIRVTKVGNNGELEEVKITSFGFDFPETFTTSFDPENAQGTNAKVTFRSGVVGVTSPKYVDRKGFLSDVIKIQDNDLYQEFSYVVQTGVDFDIFEDLIKKSVHPAGMKIFGEQNINSLLNLSVNQFTANNSLFNRLFYDRTDNGNLDAGGTLDSTANLDIDTYHLDFDLPKPSDALDSHLDLAEDDTDSNLLSKILPTKVDQEDSDVNTVSNKETYQFDRQFPLASNSQDSHTDFKEDDDETYHFDRQFPLASNALDSHTDIDEADTDTYHLDFDLPKPSDALDSTLDLAEDDTDTYHLDFDLPKPSDALDSHLDLAEDDTETYHFDRQFPLASNALDSHTDIDEADTDTYHFDRQFPLASNALDSHTDIDEADTDTYHLDFDLPKPSDALDSTLDLAEDDTDTYHLDFDLPKPSDALDSHLDLAEDDTETYHFERDFPLASNALDSHLDLAEDDTDSYHFDRQFPLASNSQDSHTDFKEDDAHTYDVDFNLPRPSDALDSTLDLAEDDVDTFHLERDFPPTNNPLEFHTDLAEDDTDTFAFTKQFPFANDPLGFTLDFKEDDTDTYHLDFDLPKPSDALDSHVDIEQDLRPFVITKPLGDIASTASLDIEYDFSKGLSDSNNNITESVEAFLFKAINFDESNAYTIDEGISTNILFDLPRPSDSLDSHTDIAENETYDLDFNLPRPSDALDSHTDIDEEDEIYSYSLQKDDFNNTTNFRNDDTSSLGFILKTIREDVNTDDAFSLQDRDVYSIAKTPTDSVSVIDIFEAAQIGFNRRFVDFQYAIEDLSNSLQKNLPVQADGNRKLDTTNINRPEPIITYAPFGLHQSSNVFGWDERHDNDAWRLADVNDPDKAHTNLYYQDYTNLDDAKFLKDRTSDGFYGPTTFVETNSQGRYTISTANDARNMNRESNAEIILFPGDIIDFEYRAVGGNTGGIKTLPDGSGFWLKTSKTFSPTIDNVTTGVTGQGMNQNGVVNFSVLNAGSHLIWNTTDASPGTYYLIHGSGLDGNGNSTASIIGNEGSFTSVYSEMWYIKITILPLPNIEEKHFIKPLSDISNTADIDLSMQISMQKKDLFNASEQSSNLIGKALSDGTQGSFESSSFFLENVLSDSTIDITNEDNESRFFIKSVSDVINNIHSGDSITSRVFEKALSDAATISDIYSIQDNDIYSINKSIQDPVPQSDAGSAVITRPYVRLGYIENGLDYEYCSDQSESTF